MRLRELCRDMDVEIIGQGDPEIVYITHDSRRVEPGSLFVALAGQTHDGHRFQCRAAQLGAVAMVTANPERVSVEIPVVKSDAPRRTMAQLARRLYDQPDDKLTMIGITGTNGKTTTCFLVGQLLAGLGLCGRMGTLSYFNGVTEELAHRTTPESSEIYALLREMVDHRCRYAALEISSHAMEFDRVFRLGLQYALFTNLSQDHLDFHGDMENYFAAKQKMFGMLDSGGVALVNWDDAFGRRIRVPEGARAIRFGVSPECALRAENIDLSARNSEFDMVFEGQRQRIILPLLGMHNVYNFLCAAGVALVEGVKPADLARAGASLRAVAGRMELVKEGQDYQVVVDFAHSPDALEKVLECSSGLCEGRLIVVFGAGGDRDREKRAMMGGIADRFADLIVLTSDNPRSEDPASIMQMVRSGIMREEGDGLELQPDRYTAIKQALSMARARDMVLIAGKGHETHQEIGGKFLPFNDREVAVRILRAMEADNV